LKQDKREVVGKVNIDLSDTIFNEFTGEKTEILFHQLTCSAEWRLTRYNDSAVSEGPITGFKRKSGENRLWISTLQGYISDIDDDIYETRVMIRLEKYNSNTNKDYWTRYNRFEWGKPGDKSVELKLNKPEPDFEQPGIESYLLIAGEAVFEDN
jgi:hypothetical protein